MTASVESRAPRRGPDRAVGAHIRGATSRWPSGADAGATKSWCRSVARASQTPSLNELMELLCVLRQLGLGRRVQFDELVARALQAANQLIELQLGGLGRAVRGPRPPSPEAAMSRKPDPERIYRSRRDAVLRRLLGTGMDRAEARVAAWEARADAGGQTRHSAAYWDGAAERTETHGAAAPALRPDHDPRGPRRSAERKRPGSHRGLTLAQRIRVLAGPFPAGWPLCARQVRADPRSPPRRRCRRRSGGRSTPGRRARTGARRAGRDRPRTRRPRRRSRPSRAVDAGAVASRTFTSSSAWRGPGRPFR